MANLSQLTSRVATILVDAPAEVTGLTSQELDAAQNEAQERYAFMDMADIASINVSTVWTNSRELPSDWLRADTRQTPFYIETVGSQRTVRFVEWVPTIDDLYKLYPDPTSTTSTPGAPKHILERNDTVSHLMRHYVNVYPYPDDLYSIVVPYIARIDPPSTADYTKNWFMQKADRYLVFKAASELLTINRDHEEGQLYALKAEREFRRLMRQDKRSRMKSTTLRMQRDANAPFNQEAQRLP